MGIEWETLLPSKDTWSTTTHRTQYFHHIRTHWNGVAVFYLSFSRCCANIGSCHGNFHLFAMHVVQILIFIYLSAAATIRNLFPGALIGNWESFLSVHVMEKLNARARTSKTFRTMLMFTALALEWNWFEVSSINLYFLCWSMSVNESAPLLKTHETLYAQSINIDIQSSPTQMTT